MDLHESGEMYLETILRLKQMNGSVRSIDIANALNYSKPSVSRGVKLLKESQLIRVDGKGFIHFTDEGQQKAEKIYQLHTCITDFLVKIGVSLKQAEQDACRIEHIISEETFQCIQKFMWKQS